MAKRLATRSAAVLAILLAGHASRGRAEEASGGARAITRPERRWTLASAVQVLDVRGWAGRALRAVGSPSEASDAGPQAIVARAGWGCEQ